MPPPLAEAKVAVVTSAALHPRDGERFIVNDASYRALDHDQRQLIMGHWSPNFDRSAFGIDYNVVYPLAAWTNSSSRASSAPSPQSTTRSPATSPTTSPPSATTPAPPAPPSSRRRRRRGLPHPRLTLCSRTVCTLAHVFEAAGLATVTTTSIRSVGERMRPPRVPALRVPPRPAAGQAHDPDFQHDVLRRAFALLERESGPVLEDHPEIVVGEEEPSAAPCRPASIPNSRPPSTRPRTAQGLRSRPRPPWRQRSRQRH